MRARMQYHNTSITDVGNSPAQMVFNRQHKYKTSQEWVVMSEDRVRLAIIIDTQKLYKKRLIHFFG